MPQSGNRHTITALVQDEAGTLNRLVSLFRRRGFSIGSLTVGKCEREGYSRVTIVVHGDDRVLEQSILQLRKLVEVVEVSDVKRHEVVHRELAIIRVEASPEKRREIIEITNVAGGKVAFMDHDSLTLELTNTPLHINRTISLLRSYGRREVARSGLVVVKVAEKE